MFEVAPTPKFLLRLPPDLRADLERIAQEEHRSLTNLIVHALREWVDERELETNANSG